MPLTSEYLKDVLSSTTTLIGASLSILALLPILFQMIGATQRRTFEEVGLRNSIRFALVILYAETLLQLVTIVSAYFVSNIFPSSERAIAAVVLLYSCSLAGMVVVVTAFFLVSLRLLR